MRELELILGAHGIWQVLQMNTLCLSLILQMITIQGTCHSLSMCYRCYIWSLFRALVTHLGEQLAPVAPMAAPAQIGENLAQYLYLHLSAPTYGYTWSYQWEMYLYFYICPMLIESCGVMNGLTPGSWHPVSFCSAQQNQPAGSTARWLSCNTLDCQLELLKDN